MSVQITLYMYLCQCRSLYTCIYVSVNNLHGRCFSISVRICMSASACTPCKSAFQAVSVCPYLYATILVSMFITQKYRSEPGIEPQASRLTYERSTTELSRPIQFCYLNLGFILITLVSYRVCVCVCGVLPRAVSRVQGCVLGICMQVAPCSYLYVCTNHLLSVYLSACVGMDVRVCVFMMLSNVFLSKYP